MINGEFRGHTRRLSLFSDSSEVTRADCLFFRTVQGSNALICILFLHKLREVITRSERCYGNPRESGNSRFNFSWEKIDKNESHVVSNPFIGVKSWLHKGISTFNLFDWCENVCLLIFHEENVINSCFSWVTSRFSLAEINARGIDATWLGKRFSRNFISFARKPFTKTKQTWRR